jgi:hypothetical protein
MKGKFWGLSTLSVAERGIDGMARNVDGSIAADSI